MPTISGTAGDDVLIGTDGDDRFDLSQGGNDTVTGLAGDDVIRFGGAFTAADRISGGAGSDTLVLDGDYTGANQLVFSPTTLTHVETIRLAADHGYSLTLDEATVASGQTLTVDGGALGAGGSLYLDAHNDTDGNIVGIGGALDDVFYGGSGSNAFRGGAGDDNFRTNGGSGTLSGGRGNDAFTIVGDYEVRGGAGNDFFYIFSADPVTITPDMLRAGEGGYDILWLEHVVVLDAPRFDPADWGFELLDLGGQLIGTEGDDHWDFSGLLVSQAPFIVGMGGNDRMIGADDHFNRFYGMAGNDRLYGGDATDEMTGGTGHNKLYGGGGDDNLANFDVLSDGAGRTLMYGGAGNDQLFANNGAYHVYGGDGDDWIGFENTTVRQDTVFGGNGTDRLDLGFEGVVFDVDVFDVETTGIERLTGGEVVGSNRANILDFSEFVLVTAAGVSIEGRGGDDVLTGTYSDDTLTGGTGDDFLNGAAGEDILNGSRGNDALNGGLGQDVLTGGTGADTFSYLAAAESTGADHDTIAGFDAAGADTIDVWFTVTGIDAELASGSLSAGSIEADLIAAIGATQLAPNHAVLFMPDAGDLAGQTVLVIDGNATAGYQSGGDLVLFLDGAKHLRGLDVTDFG